MMPTDSSDLRRHFERAMAAHRRGDFESAHVDYDALLAIDPNHVDAWHMSGMLFHQQRLHIDALQRLDRALAIAPATAAILANRASIHIARGDNIAAECDAQEAARLDPTSFGAWFNLGLALRAQSKSCVSAFKRASALRPSHARALLEWFSAAALSGQLFDLAPRIRATMPSLKAQRDLALRVAEELEHHGAATAAFVVLTQLRRELPQDAQVIARQTIESRYGAAAMLEQRQQRGAALDAVNALLIDAPNHRGARMMRASLLAERGDPAAALAEYRQIVERFPTDSIGASAMLIAMQHEPCCSALDVFTAHRDWAAQHMPNIAAPWRPELPFADPNRQLRIGWMSPRFFRGLVAEFFLAELRCLDRSQFENILYDTGGVDDKMTEKFRSAATTFRRVNELDDESLCAQIRDDKIDVLVELSGHSPGNRLRMLALRPAPVQVQWLDYFHSTATRAVDVLLSDDVLTPPELEKFYTERIHRLPSGRVCYSPPVNAPIPAPRSGRPLRFASFNRINKVNDEVLTCWSRVLAAIPDSTLRMKARVFDSTDERKMFRKRCERFNIAISQIELLGYGTYSETLSAYADVDIALDPFPFSGCATSLDALWMGVPVVTLIGETMVSRQTASLLATLDLCDCITTNVDAYAERCIALAADSQTLTTLKRDLRERMRSRLCDSRRHAEELGAALRAAWRGWCLAESTASVGDQSIARDSSP